MSETKYGYSLSAARNRSNEKIEVQAAGKKNYTEKANPKFDPFSVRNPITASMTLLLPYTAASLCLINQTSTYMPQADIVHAFLSPYGPPYS